MLCLISGVGSWAMISRSWTSGQELQFLIKHEDINYLISVTWMGHGCQHSSETADLLGFTCLTVSRVYLKECKRPNYKRYPVSGGSAACWWRMFEKWQRRKAAITQITTFTAVEKRLGPVDIFLSLTLGSFLSNRVGTLCVVVVESLSASEFTRLCKMLTPFQSCHMICLRCVNCSNPPFYNLDFVLFFSFFHYTSGLILHSCGCSYQF